MPRAGLGPFPVDAAALPSQSSPAARSPRSVPVSQSRKDRDSSLVVPAPTEWDEAPIPRDANSERFGIKHGLSLRRATPSVSVAHSAFKPMATRDVSVRTHHSA